MQNFDQPVQPDFEIKKFRIAAGIKRYYEASMAENKFTNSNNIVGFLSKEPEPFVFLTLEEIVAIDDIYTKTSKTDFKLDIVLSNKLHASERQVYTFFSLIGDLGGFYDGITIIPAFFLSFYSSRMFNASILQELPIRH